MKETICINRPFSISMSLIQKCIWIRSFTWKGDILRLVYALFIILYHTDKYFACCINVNRGDEHGPEEMVHSKYPG